MLVDRSRNSSRLLCALRGAVLWDAGHIRREGRLLARRGRCGCAQRPGVLHRSRWTQPRPRGHRLLRLLYRGGPGYARLSLPHDAIPSDARPLSPGARVGQGQRARGGPPRCKWRRGAPARRADGHWYHPLTGRQCQCCALRYQGRGRWGFRRRKTLSGSDEQAKQHILWQPPSEWLGIRWFHIGMLRATKPTNYSGRGRAMKAA
mmetsp:Transcript_37489/g.120499  ORF Transcript_37489/g.120499 Transcript_37489/m.120499 type:complete len:205 (-) Transcript_37489:2311-2925(-)